MYGGANETRYANDIEDVINEINGVKSLNRTVNAAFFSSTRLLTMQSRLSAAYKGVLALLYKEKCKVALEKESSNNSSLIYNSTLLQNEEINEEDITLKFKASDGQRYALKVPKNIQFIIAILKLYSKYPNLEKEKMGTFSYNGSKIYLYESITDNGLEDGNEIIIKNDENKN